MSPEALAIVPARNEEDRIAATVEALGTLPVKGVLVVDDGSDDRTATRAAVAGARVLSSSRPVGKGSVLTEAIRSLYSRPEVFLIADGDLGETASELAPVIERVLSGEADLAIAVPPPQDGGGFGLVKRMAAGVIRRRTGFVTQAPLSGQRAITGRALAACLPLAPGYGVETRMTIDALEAGFRVVEVPAGVRHRATGRGPSGFIHRAKQGADILRATRRRRGR
jgi:glycosyltransferase involved in cell wall biosynthesis